MVSYLLEMASDNDHEVLCYLLQIAVRLGNTEIISLLLNKDDENYLKETGQSNIVAYISLKQNENKTPSKKFLILLIIGPYRLVVHKMKKRFICYNPFIIIITPEASGDWIFSRTSSVRSFTTTSKNVPFFCWPYFKIDY